MNLTRTSLPAALVLLAAPSSSHTTFQSVVQEGTRTDNALRIAHGCETPDGDIAVRPNEGGGTVFEIKLPLAEFFTRPIIAGLGETIEDILVSQLEALSDEDAEEAFALLGKEDEGQ